MDASRSVRSGADSESVDLGQSRWLGGDTDLYKALISASPNAIVATDLAGVVVFASPAAARIFGRTGPDEMIGEQILDWIAPTDVASMVTDLRCIVAEGRPCHSELTMLKKKGDGFAAELSAAVISSPQGLSEGIMFIARDIAEQTLAKSAQAEEAERRRVLIEQSKDGIGVLDLDGKLHEFNASFARMLGYTAEEMRQLHVYDWDVQWTRDEVLAKLLDFKRESTTFETRHRRKDGSFYDVEVSASAAEWGGRTYLYCVHRDITERKRAEAALREAQATIRAVFDGTFEYIGLTTPDGILIEANETALRSANVERSAVIGKPFWETPWWAHSQELQEQLRRAVKEAAGGRVVRFEAAHPTGDGTMRTIDFSLRPLRDQAGKIEYLIPEAHDITELKQHEAALREAEEKIRGVFDQTFQFIGLMTPDGVLIEANETALRLVNIDKSAVIGKPFWETPWWVHSQELQEQLRQAVKEAAAGRAVRFEATHPAGDGTVHTVDFSLRPLRDRAGNVRYLIPEGHDITERTRMESALAEEAERRRIYMEQSKDGISVLDPDGKLLEFNASFAQMLGYTAEEMSRLHVWDWNAQWTRQENLKKLRDIEKESATFEARHRRKDGSYCEVETSASAARWGGRTYLYCVHRDITERKRTELAQAHEVVRQRIFIEQSKDGIAVLDADGNLHEFNASFARMLGYAEPEMRGLHVWDWNVHLTRDEILARLQAAEKEAFTFETRHRRKDGNSYDVEVSINPAQWGGRTYLYCAYRDITARKEAEREVEKLHKELMLASRQAAMAHFDGVRRKESGSKQ
ncbi:MAG TPA: PAS domain S-box protein [Verrucomicrobiae bacterium]|nr:PAS domain S-box protein [Verrucomicrobiae bacterium]